MKRRELFAVGASVGATMIALPKEVAEKIAAQLFDDQPIPDGIVVGMSKIEGKVYALGFKVSERKGHDDKAFQYLLQAMESTVEGLQAERRRLLLGDS